ncbi:MAG: diacylglycerol kinase family lipid kinase [Calditrichaeota bacterium]|nr:diacylglycerol kinase family lipid kinase [Calditrichota bacterium]
MNLLFLVNPNAGHGKALKVLPKIEEYCRKQAINYEIIRTEYPWHGIELIKNTDLSRFDGVVACGGDGTNFELINGYFSNPLKNKPPIGIVPVGTGNAFAKDVSLENGDWEKAMNIISNGKTKQVDVMRFRTEDKDYHLLNIIGAGFVADVGATANQLKVLGEMSYILGVFYQLVKLGTFKITLNLDGSIIERDAVFVEVANTRYTGSIFLMAPDAKIDDGLLDIIILKEVSRRKLLKLFPTIFKGNHINYDEVEYFKAKKISIQSDIKKTLIPDGEIMGSTPFEVECLPGSVKVFWK